MGRELRFDVISELKCMWKMPSVPNKMYRHRRIDEAVINEFNCIKQIYKRFQAPFGLNWKMYFQGNLLFSGQNFSAPPVKCLPVRLCLRAQSNLAKCKRIFVPTHNSWRRLKSFFRIVCLEAFLSTCLNSVTPLQCCLSLLLLMHFLSRLSLIL